MGDRIAGVCFLKFSDGTMLPLGESFTVRPAIKNREPVTGIDGSVRYKETPVSPSIEAEALLTDDLNIGKVLSFTNGTLVAEAANGKVYTLLRAFQSGQPDLDLAEGKGTFLFHGSDMKIKE